MGSIKADVPVRMTKKTNLISLVVLAALCLATGQVDSPLYRHESSPLEIRTNEGAVIQMTTVVVADREEHRRGLMYVRHLPVNQSLLFVYNNDVKVTFWMKNTYVPLDLVFIQRNGEIVDIIKDTVPLSTEKLESDQWHLAVLELNAGLCKKLGIEIGDVVEHEFFESQ